MKIQFRIRGLNANASLRVWLEKQLERLRNLIPVASRWSGAMAGQCA